MKNVDIFTKVDPNDYESLLKKAYNSTQWLKGFAIVRIILYVIVVLIMFTGLLAFSPHLMINQFMFNKPLIVGNLNVASFGFSLFFIVLLCILCIKVFILIYISKLQSNLKNNNIPNLSISYILTAFSIISFLTSISSFRVINFVVSGFNCYLWYVFISSIKNLERLEY